MSATEGRPPARAHELRIALVVSAYHELVTSGLESGAKQALVEFGVPPEQIVAFSVPGSFELAQAAYVLAASREWHGIVCLGCLIRGETPHFDYIARAAADGIMRAAQETGVPVGFGVLTTNTADEALARSAAGSANKGRETARAVAEMAVLYARIAARTTAGR
jgi:6,7-dimethyl-8-ribityllumazine synthase